MSFAKFIICLLFLFQSDLLFAQDHPSFSGFGQMSGGLREIPLFDTPQFEETIHVPLRTIVIPKRYTGEKRAEISNLLKKLEEVCPDCDQVEEPDSINSFPIQSFPEIFVSPSINGAIVTEENECSIPFWLVERQFLLDKIEKKFEIKTFEGRCPRKFVIKLIEELAHEQ